MEHFIAHSRFSKLDNVLRHHVTFFRRTSPDTNMKFYDVAQLSRYILPFPKSGSLTQSHSHKKGTSYEFHRPS